MASMWERSPACRDEPASVLIGRIRAAHQVEAQKPKGKPMSNPKPQQKSQDSTKVGAALSQSRCGDLAGASLESIRPLLKSWPVDAQHPRGSGDPVPPRQLL